MTDSPENPSNNEQVVAPGSTQYYNKAVEFVQHYKELTSNDKEALQKFCSSSVNEKLPNVSSNDQAAYEQGITDACNSPIPPSIPAKPKSPNQSQR